MWVRTEEESRKIKTTEPWTWVWSGVKEAGETVKAQIQEQKVQFSWYKDTHILVSGHVLDFQKEKIPYSAEKRDH